MSAAKDQEGPSDFELMDQEDEQQILMELRGVPVDKFIYKNKRGEYELTYAGTKWVVRQMAEIGEAIRVDTHPKTGRCEIDPEYLTCTVLGKRVKVDREAKSETVLDSNIGAARQWSKQKINEGKTIIPDEHFFSKCVSRATRNLQLSMIPTDFKKAMIEKLKEMQGKGGQSQQRPQGQQNQQQNRPAGGGEQQSRPAGQGEQPKPSGAQGAQGTGAPGQQAQRPQGQQTQQTQQKPQNQQTPQTQRPAQGASGGGAGRQPVALEAIQQGFRAVFIQFTKTEDKATCQKVLKALTGKIAITDLERELMVELGPLLRKAINGQVKWNGTALHEISSGEQLWPKVEPQHEEAPTPQQEEAPPPQEDPPMF